MTGKKHYNKKTVEVKQSSLPKYLHVPNGQMLKGVQLQSGKGYEIPHSSDVHTFSTKKRIKNKS